MESRKKPQQGKIERIRRLTRNDFLEITNKSSRELLTLLNRTAFGFESFLKRRDYLIDENTLDYELIELMVDAASRICTIRQLNALGAIERFLKTLGDCEKFVFCDALDVINDCLEEKKKSFLSILYKELSYYFKKHDEK
ncbi:NFX1-type zinc finger-containing protein 1 [Caerostris extrusa]|uniref:NFX1-type zinc finger-containing protein 1 n=1 Tax=Caerostris extrusa TaxID=172846 RepID=A0AAV4P437_CAEEX|nr:NFX1-type zinc finger-containing protein 1 [Caerostris extrusa]